VASNRAASSSAVSAWGRYPAAVSSRICSKQGGGAGQLGGQWRRRRARALNRL
jgi:hypothetical protein